MAFERLKRFLRGDKKMDAPRYLKDIWQLNGVPAFYAYWLYGIWPWKFIYRGYYKMWHWIYWPTVAEPKGYRDMYRLNAAKFVCNQLANYIWGEQAEVNVSAAGIENADDDPLAKFIAYVLEQNDFNTKMGELEEKVLAMGGGAIKQWCETEDRDPTDNDRMTSVLFDELGNPVKRVPCRVPLSYHTADQFVPTAWNNHDVTEGIFVSREARQGWYYSRLEWHKWDGQTYVVSNDVYRNQVKDTPTMQDSGEGIYAEPQNILGWWYSLNQIYPLLSPETKIENLKRSLFCYIKPAGANVLDDNSPLGMSIYANALDTLRSLDETFDGFVNEIKLGRRRIIVPARALEPYIDAATGKPVRYFNEHDSVYEAMNFDNVNDLKINDTTMDIRTDAYVSALNGLLSQLCTQIGADAGMLAFDKAQGMKTATEVISEQSKTYTVVQAHKNNLKCAIEKMVHNILDIAALYNIEFDGVMLKPLIERGYEINVHFDDSIIQDKAAEQQQAIMELSNGVRSKTSYLCDVRGMTEEQAAEELKRIADESKVTGDAIDLLEAGGLE